MSEVYKIKHIPSGYFLKPSTNGSNLSKKGKVYEGNMVWTKVQNRTMYTLLRIQEWSNPKLFKEMKEKFPDAISNTSYNLYIPTKPEDFEKVNL